MLQNKVYMSPLYDVYPFSYPYFWKWLPLGSNFLCPLNKVDSPFETEQPVQQKVFLIKYTVPLKFNETDATREIHIKISLKEVSPFKI